MSYNCKNCGNMAGSTENGSCGQCGLLIHDYEKAIAVLKKANVPPPYRVIKDTWWELRKELKDVD